MPVIIISGRGSGGGPAPSTLPAVGYIELAREFVTSTRSGAVYRVPLARFPASWWAQGVDPDGGNIRVYLGDSALGTPVPMDVVAINNVSKTGDLYFKGPAYSTTESAFFVAVGSDTMPAPTDPLGRNAVWDDFYAVYIASANDGTQAVAPAVDRTGNCADLTFYNHTMTITASGFEFDASDDFAKTTVVIPAGKQFGMGVTLTPRNKGFSERAFFGLADQTVASGTGKTAFLSMNTSATAATSWTSWGAQYIAFGSLSTGVEYHVVGTQNGGTGARAAYNNGVLAASAASSSPDVWATTVSPLDMNIGCRSSLNTASPQIPAGHAVRRAYVRKGIGSDADYNVEHKLWQQDVLTVFDPSDVSHLYSQYWTVGGGAGAHTIVAVPLGYAHADREIIVVIQALTTYTAGDDGGHITGITLGGVPVTIDANVYSWFIVPSGGNLTTIVGRVKPTGHVGDLVITTNTNIRNARFSLYYCNKTPTLLTPVTNKSAANVAVTATVDIPSRAVAIFGFHGPVGSSPPYNVTWTGTDITEGFESFGIGTYRSISSVGVVFPLGYGRMGETYTAISDYVNASNNMQLAGAVYQF